MLLEIFIVGAVKLMFSLIAFYALLSVAAKTLKLRFASPRVALRLTGLLAGTAFFFDFSNFYIMRYAGWDDFWRMLALLFLLIAYLLATLFLIWYLLRDTHKKTIYVWVVFSAVYLALMRVYWAVAEDLLFF